MRWKRWLFIGAGTLLVLSAVLLVAAHFYLRSSAMARRAEDKLQEALGVPVRVGGVAIGLAGSSSARQIEVLEPKRETPWLTLEEVTANLSVLDLLSGNAEGGKVRVRGARVHLRFDSRGRLLTELPKPSASSGKSEAPTLHLEKGELTLEQEGRAPVVLSGLSADMEAKGGSWQVQGNIEDPHWGDWNVEAGADLKTGAVTLNLLAEKSAVSPDRLRALPFVSPAVWDQVTGEGPARVALKVRVGADRTIHYRVEIDPRGAKIQVSSIGLDAISTTGAIIVEDGLVTLRNMKGKAAGGEIETHGDLDFRQEPWKFTVESSTRGVDLQRFTRTWPLPPQLRDISGRLTGEAKLVLKISDKLQVSGNGEGRVEDAVLLPKKSGDEPIKINNLRLRLYYVDGKPKFSTEMSLAPSLQAAVAVALLFPTQTAPQKKDTVEDLLTYPAQAASLLQRGIREAAHAVADTGKKVIGSLPRAGQPKPPGMGPTYFEASFELKDVDLHQLVERLRLQLPFPITGRGSIQVQVAMPVETPGDLAAYRMNGTISLAHVKLAELELDRVEGRVRLNKGIIQLEKLRGEVPDGKSGTFQGTARMQLAPLGDLTASLTLDNIPVRRVLSLIPELQKDAGGTFSGSATFRSPARKLQDPTAWEVRGTARADKLRILGTALDKASTRAQLQRGELSLTDTRLGVEGLEAQGSANLTLRDNYPFLVRIELNQVDLSAVKKLTPGLNLPLTVEGQLTAGANLRGSLAPFKVGSSGTVDATKLKLGDVNFSALKTGWKLDERKLTLSDLSAQLYKGQVSGSAVMPLRDEEGGSIDLAVKGLDVGGLVKDLKGFPLRLSGEASGKLEGKLNPAKAGGERELISQLNLDAPRLLVQNVPAEKIRARINYQSGVVRYKVEGSALGGTFDIEGRWPATVKPAAGEQPEEQNPPEDPPRGTEGTIRFRQARLGRLMRALTGQDAPSPLGGIIDLELRYETDASGELQGTGRLILRQLSWEHTELAASLSGAIRLRNSILELRDFGGEVAGGLVRFRAGFHLKNAERGWADLRLEHMELARLAAFVPRAESAAQGPIDLHVHVRLGREWHGSGEAHLVRGKIAGLEVSEWRLPFRFSYLPDVNSGQVRVDDSSLQVGAGRATVRVTAGWEVGLRLDGAIVFRAIEVRSLGQTFVALEHQLGSGRLSGRFDFAGQDIHALQDLNARLDVDFAQAQPLQLPVLSQITPYLRGVTTSTSFEKGDLRATLGRGIWRVRRLALLGSFANVFAEGTVTLQQSRLDLEVTARTGELVVNPVLLRLVSLSLGQPLSIEVLARASEWLSNRVVHLHIGGTIRNPDIHVERLRLLTDETIRFFFLQAARPSASPRSVP
jgi:uncharacterized protein involved in outer membrane biogenesis